MDGLFVKVSVPDDADVSACQGASVDIISGTQNAEEAGIVDRMWILGIDSARHVLWARTFGATALDISLVSGWSSPSPSPTVVRSFLARLGWRR